jgi:hypothetical protein
MGALEHFDACRGRGHARKAAPGECAGNDMYTVRDRPALTIVKRVNIEQTYRLQS